jgi:hypothetical protein
MSAILTTIPFLLAIALALTIIAHFRCWTARK